MHPRPTTLLNTPAIEAWPAWLLRARSNADARLLARARRVLRRKRDGRYLAAVLDSGLMPLVPRFPREPGVDAILDRLDTETGPGEARDPAPLPLDTLDWRAALLGLDVDAYAAGCGLDATPEPETLLLAGFDRYRRPLWLLASAARGWQRMQAAAARDGVALDAISGYRSHDYQLGIFERKLSRGLSLDDILRVNAVPGFSEHHAGTAVDIGTPGEPPAEESFEDTPAFAWLRAHADGHGFDMSYPRDNPHGIVYEPWHWRYIGA